MVSTTKLMYFFMVCVEIICKRYIYPGKISRLTIGSWPALFVCAPWAHSNAMSLTLEYAGVFLHDVQGGIIQLEDGKTSIGCIG